MTEEILQWAHIARTEFPFEPGRVLEVGSCNVNGTIRDIFPDATEYLGVDLKEGPGVDRVLPGDQLLIEFATKPPFDTVLCCEMLEHDRTPWKTLAGLHGSLRTDGYLIITTPSYGFPVHRYPKDYYRYGIDTYVELFFDGFEILKLSEVFEAKTGYSAICGLGRKKGIRIL